MTKKSKKDKDKDTEQTEYIYPDVSSILDYLGKPTPPIDFPSFEECYSDIASSLRKIKIPAPKVYTEAEYEELKVKLRKANRALEELKKVLEESKNKYQNELHRQLYSRYFSKTVVEKILQRKIQLRTGRRCEITVLNCDIRCFAKFTNKVDPEYLTELLNEYLIECTKILHRHSAAVDKYLGDGILAYFGWLNRAENHAVNACEAAIEIIKKTDSIFEEWYAKLTEDPKSRYLGIGIGIATGHCYWDYIGPRNRRELTIVGRHVNLASRLQSKADGGKILISNITRGKLKGKFDCEKLEKGVSIPGFEGNVDVFRLKEQA